MTNKQFQMIRYEIARHEAMAKLTNDKMMRKSYLEIAEALTEALRTAQIDESEVVRCG